MKRSVLTLVGLVWGTSATPCVQITDGPEAEMPVEAREALTARLAYIEFDAPTPTVWTASVGEPASGTVDLEMTIAGPEPGLSLVRRVNCFYRDFWTCADMATRYFNHRGQPVRIADDVAASKVRDAFAQMERLVGQRGGLPPNESTLSSSDLERIRSVGWLDDEVRAGMDDGSCGTELLFRKRCRGGICGLEYAGREFVL